MLVDHPVYSSMPKYDDFVADDSKTKPCGESAPGSLPLDDGRMRVESSAAEGHGPIDEYHPDADTRSSISPSHSPQYPPKHFYESSRIPNAINPPPYPQEASRAVGQKFRRPFSGDGNPPDGHRRVNSLGKAAIVTRRPFVQDRRHQRVDSAGLDILTAAVDASQEELTDTAGHRSNIRPYSHCDVGSSSGARRSPAEMIAYDHGSLAVSGSAHPYRYPPGPSSNYYAQQGYAYPPHYYGPPSYRRTIPGAPPPPPGGYPVQYARGPDPYIAKPPHGPSGPHAGIDYTHESREEASVPSYKPRLDHAGPSMDGPMIPPAPVPSSHWRGNSLAGTAHDVPSYGSSVGGTGEGTMPLPSNFQSQSSGEHVPPYHHRKSSSLSSWAVPLQLFMGPPSAELGDHPLKGHHRTTSSSISLLGGLDIAALAEGDATFLKNVQSSSGVSAPPLETKPLTPRSTQDVHSSDEDSPDNGRSKLAAGGTSKRVRRKCNIEGCENRVVQGGLCITHGAKRKHCKYPGCTKNVKKVGLCSTHGPARKRCDAEGCTKVAVQGGKCIAHGAKKKLCVVEGCAKQAILSGMCKKHHDSARTTNHPLRQDNTTLGIDEYLPATCKPVKPTRKPTHTRGLSLFQEMSPEDVGNALGDAPTQPRHRSTFSRDYPNIYRGDD